MSTPTRVVIADDSPFMVRTLMQHLRSEPGFVVVGTAVTALRAVQLVEKLRPDVVTLDVEMPGWADEENVSVSETEGGLQALQQIMKDVPTPVVMVSGVSREAAAITMQAVEAGAVDFSLKYTPGVNTDPKTFRSEFLDKVRSAAGVRVVRTVAATEPAKGDLDWDARMAAARERMRSRDAAMKNAAVTESSGNAVADQNENPLNRTGNSASDQLYQRVNSQRRSELTRAPEPARRPSDVSRSSTSACEVLIIGASTGGPTALRELLTQLPRDFSLPIVIVQHMPAAFTGVLAAQLERRLELRVREAWDNDPLLPGSVLIAPGGQHLKIEQDNTVSLFDAPKVLGHRPSIDVTMKSAVQSLGRRVAGVILTGMGEDGAIGLAEIHTAGGATFAQQGDTCVVNGMPGRAIELGAADWVGSPAEIGQRLAETWSVNTEPHETEAATTG
ncbi:MAG: two-component system chemotaxis response regulator CheB [Planctomycetaceae bacterium]|jgi:two-component system chemotaxis response regulator CheB